LHEAQIAAGGGDVPLSNSKTLAPSRSLPVLKLVATRCGPDAATASQKIGQFPSMPPRGAAQMRAAPTLDPRPRWLSPPSAAHRMAGPRGSCEERRTRRRGRQTLPQSPAGRQTLPALSLSMPKARGTASTVGRLGALRHRRRAAARHHRSPPRVAELRALSRRDDPPSSLPRSH